MDYPWNLVDREEPTGARRRGGKMPVTRRRSKSTRRERLARPLGSHDPRDEMQPG